jgi:hypothetical protein
MRISKTDERFFEPVQIIGGPKTRAIVQRPSQVDQPGLEFAHPKLTCRVRRDSLVKSGQVITIQGGANYLVCDHFSDQDWRIHHLFRCDRQVDWTRPQVGVDPLTKLERAGGQQELLGTIWVMWERVRREFVDLSLRISQEQYTIATGAPVQINDYIDGKKVDRVASALGVTIAVLQG